MRSKLASAECVAKVLQAGGKVTTCGWPLGMYVHMVNEDLCDNRGRYCGECTLPEYVRIYNNAGHAFYSIDGTEEERGGS